MALTTVVFLLGYILLDSGTTLAAQQYTGNIAKGKPTDQSSFGWNGPSSRAVDGNANTRYGAGSCTHTQKDQGAWWKVDLVGKFRIGKVAITNRADCCWNILRNFEVRVGNSPSHPKKNRLCIAVSGALGKGETRTLTCSPSVVGRYVFVAHRGKEYLTLCEVQVFAVIENIAKGKPTSQSSTGWNGPSSLAVDGNFNTNYGGKSCTHTKKQQGAWWRVDLGKQFTIQKVAITNRGDCCHNILRKFDIRIGDSGGNCSQDANSNALCVRVVGSLGKSETRKFVCRKPLRGRYVYVKSNIKEYLTLCEVQVFPYYG